MGSAHFSYLDLQNLLQHPWMITNGVVGAGEQRGAWTHGTGRRTLNAVQATKAATENFKKP
jgi:hypothetical protein